MRRLLRIIGIFLLLAIAGIGYAAYRLSEPYQGFQNEVYVDLPHGITTSGMADRLAAAGAIRSKWDFLLARMATRVSGRGRALKAGEYRFERAASPADVLDRIARGDVFYFSLVVPEGKNMFEIGAAAEHLGLFPADQFVAAARNPALVHDIDPHALSLEGYLYPDTYKLSRHITPEDLCKHMTGKFREVWRGLKADVVPHDAVTLASLVEKEGKLPEDRPMIAGVFQNRLRIGMRLECDPTTIYAAELEGRYRGTIHRSDLENRNAYNTYQHAGLPPGPIANPGSDALRAAMHPAQTDALFFVLKPDGSGGHEFSKDLQTHHKAVDRYRNGLKKPVR